MTTKDRYERLYEAGILNEYGSLFKLGMWEFIESEIATAERNVIERVRGALIEAAEPYDGSKWHNNLSIETIKRVLDSLTNDSSKE